MPNLKVIIDTSGNEDGILGDMVRASFEAQNIFLGIQGLCQRLISLERSLARAKVEGDSERTLVLFGELQLAESEIKSLVEAGACRVNTLGAAVATIKQRFEDKAIERAKRAFGE